MWMPKNKGSKVGSLMNVIMFEMLFGFSFHTHTQGTSIEAIVQVWNIKRLSTSTMRTVTCMQKKEKKKNSLKTIVAFKF